MASCTRHSSDINLVLMHSACYWDVQQSRNNLSSKALVMRNHTKDLQAWERGEGGGGGGLLRKSSQSLACDLSCLRSLSYFIDVDQDANTIPGEWMGMERRLVCAQHLQRWSALHIINNAEGHAHIWCFSSQGIWLSPTRFVAWDWNGWNFFSFTPNPKPSVLQKPSTELLTSHLKVHISETAQLNQGNSKMLDTKRGQTGHRKATPTVTDENNEPV